LSTKKRIRRNSKGVVIVNTGKGKGKTTAALGAMLRAWGRGSKVCMIQFLKHERGKWGEIRAAAKLEGFDIIATGDGFSWQTEDESKSIELARQGWEQAKQVIRSQAFDLVVLDEFTYPLDFGWIESGEVVSWLRDNKPEEQHLVITGRGAPKSLLDYADIVSEMVKVKHHHDQGQPAQAGVEF
jgi:cob(I)alamin adenosyltransferase